VLRKLLAIFLIMFCANLWANTIKKSTNSAGLLAQMLQQSNTLTGNFSQLTLDGNGSKLQEMSGTLQLKRGYKFKWHIVEPLEQLVVSNGIKVWMYDPDLEQVTVQNLDSRFIHTPGVLLSGNAEQIEQAFNVSHSEAGDLIDFILKPKKTTEQDSSLFVSLRVSLRRGVLNDMQMIDSVGQRTNIVFFALKHNEKIADSVFEFTIPAGVDVIEQ